MRGPGFFAQEFSPLSLQLKNCPACRKAEEHRVNHPAYLPALEGCSWSTGELSTIPPNWKRGTLSAHVCGDSTLGSLGRRSSNVSIFDCWLNSLRRLVFSHLSPPAVFVTSLSGGLSRLCLEWLPGLGALPRSSQHFSLASLIFFRNSDTSSPRLFKVSHLWIPLAPSHV